MQQNNNIGDPFLTYKENNVAPTFNMMFGNNFNNPVGNQFLNDNSFFDNNDFFNFNGIVNNQNVNNPNVNPNNNLNQSVSFNVLDNTVDRNNHLNTLEEQYSRSKFNFYFRNADKSYNREYFPLIPRAYDLENTGDTYIVPMCYLKGYNVLEFRDLVTEINKYENNKDKNKSIKIDGIEYPNVATAISSRLYSGYFKVLDVSDCISFGKYVCNLKYYRKSLRDLEIIGSCCFGTNEIYIVKVLITGINPILYNNIIHLYANNKGNFLLMFTKCTILHVPYSININHLNNCYEIVFVSTIYTKLFYTLTNDETLKGNPLNPGINTFYITEYEPIPIMNCYLVEGINPIKLKDYNKIIDEYYIKTNEFEKAKYDYSYYLQLRMDDNYFKLTDKPPSVQLVKADLPKFIVDQPYEDSRISIIGIISKIINEKSSPKKIYFLLNSLINEDKMLIEIKDVDLIRWYIEPQLIIELNQVCLKIDKNQNIYCSYDNDSSIKLYGFVEDTLLTKINENKNYKTTPLIDIIDLTGSIKKYKINRKRKIEEEEEDNKENSSKKKKPKNNPFQIPQQIENNNQYQVPSIDENNKKDEEIISMFNNIDDMIEKKPKEDEKEMEQVNNNNISGYEPKPDINMTDIIPKKDQQEVDDLKEFDINKSHDMMDKMEKEGKDSTNKKESKEDSINYDDILEEIEKGNKKVKWEFYKEIVERFFPMLIRKTFKYYINILKVYKIDLIVKPENKGLFMFEKRLLQENENVIEGEKLLEEEYKANDIIKKIRYAISSKELVGKDIIIYAEITDGTMQALCEFNGQSALSIINKIKNNTFIDNINQMQMFENRRNLYLLNKKNNLMFTDQDIKNMTNDSMFIYAVPKSRVTTHHDPLREPDILKFLERGEEELNKSYNDLALNDRFSFFNGMVVYKIKENIIDIENRNINRDYELSYKPWLLCNKITTGLERKENLPGDYLYLKYDNQNGNSM